MERYWFRRVMAGEDAAERYSPGDAAFDEATADPAVVAGAWATWRAEVGHADLIRERIDGRVGQ